MGEIERRIAAIGDDREHGATFLAMEAVRVLAAAAAAYVPGPGRRRRLSEVARRLAAAKPAMAAVRNATQRLLEDLRVLASVEGPSRADALAERLLVEMQASTEAAVSNAARLIDSDAIIATCSYSSAVLGMARRMFAEGKPPRAMVLEQAPKPPSAGHMLGKALGELGLAVELSDSAADVFEQATVAITGADAVSPGWVVNGAPTLALAEAASAACVPYYVVCETMKLTDRTRGAPGYDLVPLALVAGVVTEDGLQSVGDIHRALPTKPPDRR